MLKVYEQPATVYGLRCYLFRFLSKLDIRTARSYEFDVKPTLSVYDDDVHVGPLLAFDFVSFRYRLGDDRVNSFPPTITTCFVTPTDSH